MGISTACSPQNSQPQGQLAFPVVLRGPDRAFHSSGSRRPQVSQQGRRVHQGGIPRVLIGDQYHSKGRHHQRAAVYRFVQTRGRTPFAMARCMLADSGFSSSMWVQLFMTTAHLKNRTSRKALKMETPFKMIYVEEADLSHLHVIGARCFAHIKDSRKFDTVVWDGKVYDFSEDRKSYRVWNSNTGRVVESRNATFMETPLHLPPPPSQLSPLQDVAAIVGSRRRYSGQRLHLVRLLTAGCKDFTGVLDFTANLHANHENAGGV